MTKKGFVCTVYNTGKSKDINDPGVINIKSFFDLMRKLSGSKEQYLHAHGGADLYKKSIVLLLLQLFAGKKWLLTIHSGGIIKDLQTKGTLMRRLISAVFNRSEKIICVNDKIMNTLISMYVGREKCVVIPAFSFSEPENSDSLPEDMRRYIESHEPLMSCAGYSFAPHYGYDTAMEALRLLRKRYPGAGLIIMGGSKNENDYINLAERFKSGGFHDVLCSGDIGHESVLSVIGKSTVYLRPSLHDGDSISVREALAMGIPVIASDAEERPEGTVLFQTRDAADLERKIASVIENMHGHKQKAHSMSDNKNLEAVFRIYDGLIKYR